MASFILKRHADFEFSLEDDPEKVYRIPNVSKLSFEEAQLMAKFGDEDNLVKQGKLVKSFILKHVPELEEKGLGDMEYYAILGAYIKENRNENLGESSASLSS